jgi:hypothetical protein
MRLSALEPQFTRITSPGHYQDVERLEDAHGVMFLCPKCYAANGGAEGTHCVFVWFRDRGVPAEETPGPGRWAVAGTGIDDLTLSPSINLENLGHVGCGWHGFVINGEAR